MSSEAFVISALVYAGSPRKALANGLTDDDFTLYDEEWKWLCLRHQLRDEIFPRRFKRAFPEFELITTDEPLEELLKNFRQERAYTKFSIALEQVAMEINHDNVFDMVEHLSEVIRTISAEKDPGAGRVLLGSNEEYFKRLAFKRDLRAKGISFGIKTGLKNLDHHWGGLVPGRMIVVLGRPGDAKSFFMAKPFVEAFWQGKNVVMFSPEMDEDEHRARIATLLSAKKDVQEAAGLKSAFKNRPLLEGDGFNYKTYKKFWEFIEEQPGNMVLLNQGFGRKKFTPGYIESEIEAYGAHVAVIDPIYKLKSTTKRFSRFEELTDLTDSIADMSKRLNIPILVSNQAHRQTGNKGDAPGRDQSFGSDAPVQEAAHVVGVKHFHEERRLVLRCTKNRFGGNFRVDVKFIPNEGVMEDITPLRGNYFQTETESDVEEMIEEMKDSPDDE